MNIILATDSNYVRYCATTMMSVVINNPSCVFYVLTDYLSDEDIAMMSRVVSKNNSELNILYVDKYQFKDFPMPNNASTNHITLATYYRLFITELIPKNVQKAIYLDCDIIVRKKLTDLWLTDIDNNALAAVYQMDDYDSVCINRLGYEMKYGYFNAGVLLINLDYWREHDAFGNFVNYLKKNGNLIEFHDQDVLNAVFHEKSTRLSCTWNMMTVFFKKSIFSYNIVSEDGTNLLNQIYNNNQILQCVKDPAIVHFVARPKAWSWNCKHPLKKEFIKYYKQTFCDYPYSIREVGIMLFVEVLRQLNLSPYIK